MQQKTSSKSSWAELLKNVSSTRPDGDGWKTAREISAEIGKDIRTTRYRIDAAMKKGTVEGAQIGGRLFFRKATS